MQRIRKQWQAEIVRLTVALCPPGVQELLREDRNLCHFFFGDTVFAGIQPADGKLGCGCPINAHPHLTYPWSQIGRERDNVPIIVIPRDDWIRWDVLLHEIGHAVHLCCADLADMELAPVSEYAKTDHYEAFAESFCAYVWADEAPRYGEDQWGLAKMTLDDVLWFDSITL